MVAVVEAVDPYHAGPRRRAPAGARSSSPEVQMLAGQPVDRIVGDPGRLAHVLETESPAAHRSEDFLLRDLHRRLHAGEQRRRHVVSLLKSRPAPSLPFTSVAPRRLCRTRCSRARVFCCSGVTRGPIVVAGSSGSPGWNDSTALARKRSMKVSASDSCTSSREPALQTSPWFAVDAVDRVAHGGVPGRPRRAG